MKTLVLFFLGFFITLACEGNYDQDSIQNVQITKEVVEKLHNDELIQLIKDLEYIRSTQGEKYFVDDPYDLIVKYANNPSFILGLISILMIVIILLISIPFYFNYRKTRSFHRLIYSYIERDKEISNNIILSNFKSRTDLQKSIILIFTGIGISIVLALVIGGRSWSLGLIPFIIGIGYFVTSRLEK